MYFHMVNYLPDEIRVSNIDINSFNKRVVCTGTILRIFREERNFRNVILCNSEWTSVNR